MLLRENCCWSLLTLKGLMSSHNTTPSLRWSICMTTLKCWRGGGGALLNNVLYGEAPLRSNPLTLLYTIFDRKGSPSCIPSTGKMVPRSHTYNQGQSTWVTLLWYLSFSLPMQFCNGFFRGIVQVRGQHWNRQGKGGWAQHFKDIPSIDPSSNVTDCS